VTEREDLLARVQDITRGKGVRAVYDSAGRDTFMASLDCLAPLGIMVSYGNSTGPVPPIAPLELTKRGSLFLTRPALFNYVSTPRLLAKAARELFAIVASGRVKITIGQRYPLADAAQAHRDLEARRTTGCTVLIP
jgi:NADPH2:quinone reductase